MVADDIKISTAEFEALTAEWDSKYYTKYITNKDTGTSWGDSSSGTATLEMPISDSTVWTPETVWHPYSENPWSAYSDPLSICVRCGRECKHSRSKWVEEVVWERNGHILVFEENRYLWFSCEHCEHLPNDQVLPSSFTANTTISYGTTWTTAADASIIFGPA